MTAPTDPVLVLTTATMHDGTVYLSPNVRVVERSELFACHAPAIPSPGLVIERKTHGGITHTFGKTWRKRGTDGKWHFSCVNKMQDTRAIRDDCGRIVRREHLGEPALMVGLVADDGAEQSVNAKDFVTEWEALP